MLALLSAAKGLETTLVGVALALGLANRLGGLADVGVALGTASLACTATAFLRACARRGARFATLARLGLSAGAVGASLAGGGGLPTTLCLGASAALQLVQGAIGAALLEREIRIRLTRERRYLVSHSESLSG